MVPPLLPTVCVEPRSVAGFGIPTKVVSGRRFHHAVQTLPDALGNVTFRSQQASVAFDTFGHPYPEPDKRLRAQSCT